MKLNLENSKPQHEANFFLENLFVFLKRKGRQKNKSRQYPKLTVGDGKVRPSSFQY